MTEKLRYKHTDALTCLLRTRGLWHLPSWARLLTRRSERRVWKYLVVRIFLNKVLMYLHDVLSVVCDEALNVIIG